MVYLLLMVVAAVIAIARLSLQQRRERAHLASVEIFRSSLETLSEQSSLYYRPRRRSGGTRPMTIRTGVRPVPLDDARREAAKRRLAARRRARASARALS